MHVPLSADVRIHATASATVNGNANATNGVDCCCNDGVVMTIRDRGSSDDATSDATISTPAIGNAIACGLVHRRRFHRAVVNANAILCPLPPLTPMMWTMMTRKLDLVVAMI
jgi:hypothetical protein